MAKSEVVQFQVLPTIGSPLDVVAPIGEKTVAFYKVVAEPDAAIIYYMYVRRQHRHRGIGVAILNRLKESFACIKTQVAPSTSESITFLKKHGFKQVGNELVWTTEKHQTNLYVPSSSQKNMA